MTLMKDSLVVLVFPSCWIEMDTDERLSDGIVFPCWIEMDTDERLSSSVYAFLFIRLKRWTLTKDSVWPMLTFLFISIEVAQ